jgi:phospholipase C
MAIRLSRRHALQAFTAAAGAYALGCSPTVEEVDDQGGAASATRELLSRYKKFVIVVMENRSFDHYFGHLSLPDNERTALGCKGRRRPEVNGFTALARHTNPDLNNNRVGIHRPLNDDGTVNYMIGDIDHEWEACHEQFNGGDNGGFVKAHQEDLALLERQLKGEDVKALCLGTTSGTRSSGGTLPWPTEEKIQRIENKAYCGRPNDPMAFYTDVDTPIYHQLIEEYTLCDKWFASVMGPTWPNRFYIHSGTTKRDLIGFNRFESEKGNKPIRGVRQATLRNSIFGLVSDRADELLKEEIYKKRPAGELHRLCVNFFADVPLLPIMYPTVIGLTDFAAAPNFNYAHLYNKPRDGGLEEGMALSSRVFEKVGLPAPSATVAALSKWRNSETFETLALQGMLPPISIIEPPYQLAPADDHPPHDIMMGQAFIASVYEMIRNSPDSDHTLLIITYDEHGSFFDHVPPPQNRSEHDPEFQQLGFRVPSLVIGPGVSRRGVDNTEYEHCSILNTLVGRFDLRLPPESREYMAGRRIKAANPIGTKTIASSGGASGWTELKPVTLSEARVLESAKFAEGQQEIVDRAFHGAVPFEAKRIFTDGLLETFDRLGVARIRG